MPTATATNPTSQTNGAPLTGAPACPKCAGRMWDNRASKRNPKAPDFKCRDRSCDGVLWPGQHKAAVPILTPRASLATPDSAHASGAGEPGQGGASPRSAADARGISPRRQALRSCYLDVTDFVLAEVRPKYEAARMPCTDATVAAIVATLFIGVCKTHGQERRR